MSHTAFFYGTLMFPPVLYRVIYGSTNPEPWQRALTALRPAMLRGFQRHRVRFADYPAVSPSDSPGACVRGTLVTGLTDGDIFRLDRFEGDEYERRVVKVNVLKGKVGPTGRAVGGDGDEVVEEVEAEAYVWCVEMKGLEVREWDFEEFAKEKAWRWVGKEGVVEYADADAAAEELERGSADPTGGRGPDGEITKALAEQDEEKGGEEKKMG